MYKYVDENGKVSYTNTAPPSTAKHVVTSREIVESPEARAIRLWKEQRQREREAQLEEYRREQELILRERRMLQAERERMAAEQDEIERQRRAAYIINQGYQGSPRQDYNTNNDQDAIISQTGELLINNGDGTLTGTYDGRVYEEIDDGVYLDTMTGQILNQ